MELQVTEKKNLKFETFSLSPFPCLPITSAPHLKQNTSTHLPSSKSWLLNAIATFPCNLGFCVDYIFVFFIIFGRIPVKFPLRPHNCHTRGAFCHTGGVTLELGNYLRCCSVDQRLLPVSKSSFIAQSGFIVIWQKHIYMTEKHLLFDKTIFLSKKHYNSCKYRIKFRIW